MQVKHMRLNHACARGLVLLRQLTQQALRDPVKLLLDWLQQSAGNLQSSICPKLALRIESAVKARLSYVLDPQ